MTDPIYGPILSPVDVQVAVRTTIKQWVATYLAVVERLNDLDPKKLPHPKSYVLKDDGTLTKRPEDQTPSVVILCPGTAGDPVMDGEGLYRVPWAVSVAAIVSARDQETSSDVAKFYAAAIRALLVQQGSLGGFAASTRWRGERNDDLRSEDDRTLAVGVNVFEVLVRDVVQKGAGLTEPPDEPYEEAEPPTVDEVEVELNPEEIE